MLNGIHIGGYINIRVFSTICNVKIPEHIYVKRLNFTLHG